jgi:hypothetical protein
MWGVSSMAVIGFKFDPRQFGRIRFSAVAGHRAVDKSALDHALTLSLGVKVERKRQSLFGPRVASFVYSGERVMLNESMDGISLDLGLMDDEIRETLIENLRQSRDFQYV